LVLFVVDYPTRIRFVVWFIWNPLTVLSLTGDASRAAAEEYRQKLAMSLDALAQLSSLSPNECMGMSRETVLGGFPAEVIPPSFLVEPASQQTQAVAQAVGLEQAHTLAPAMNPEIKADPLGTMVPVSTSYGSQADMPS
jgi:hypothetical protein